MKVDKPITKIDGHAPTTSTLLIKITNDQS